MSEGFQQGLAAGIFLFAVLYALWPYIPWRKQIAYWSGLVMFFVGMFMAVQWVTCWWLWSVHHQRDADYPTPTECTVEVTKERFGYANTSR